MYTLLIVEDERLELETLRDYIDWTNLGISRIYTANNGLKALDIIKKNDIDIMISDIHMPGMNGIELLQTIRSLSYNTKSIFLTGYDDFNFVRSALQLEAVDYLLKPFSQTAIKNVIEKAKVTLEKERLLSTSMDVAHQKTLEQICLSENLEDISFIRQLGLYKGGSPITTYYKMWAVYGLDNYQFVQKIKESFAEIIGAVTYRGNTVFFILDIVDIKDHIERVNIIFDEFCYYTSVYCEQRIKPKEIRNQFNRLMEIETKAFYLYNFQPMCLSSLEDSDFKYLVDRVRIKKDEYDELKKYILSGNRENSIQLVDDFFEKLYGEKKSRFLEFIDQLIEFIYEIVKKENNISEQEKRTIKLEAKKINRNICYEKIRLDFKKYQSTVVELFTGYDRKKQRYVVNEILNYIHINYHQQISMDEMSERIKLTPNYIRSIFKDDQKKTILDYLTEFRLEKACELLNDPTLKVKEVSQQVGYENISYFCSIFTKRYGKSPNEYRKYL